jgi:hypothetical protein
MFMASLEYWCQWLQLAEVEVFDIHTTELLLNKVTKDDDKNFSLVLFVGRN